MTVYKPPTPLPDRQAQAPRPAVFLAGSIEMGQADDWQARIASQIGENDIDIFNPRRDNWDPSWEQSMDNPQFREQVEWELSGLEQADLIVMYLTPNTKSPISLLEFGLYADSGKLLVYCPAGFWRKGNVEIVAAQYGIPVFAEESQFLDRLRQEVQALLA